MANGRASSIHSSLGGTVAEAWTGAPALEEFPEFKLQLDEVAAVVASTAEDPAVEYLDAWFDRNDPRTTKGWFKADANISNWLELTTTPASRRFHSARTTGLDRQLRSGGRAAEPNQSLRLITGWCAILGSNQ